VVLEHFHNPPDVRFHPVDDRPERRGRGPVVGELADRIGVEKDAGAGDDRGEVRDTGLLVGPLPVPPLRQVSL